MRHKLIGVVSFEDEKSRPVDDDYDIIASLGTIPIYSTTYEVNVNYEDEIQDDIIMEAGRYHGYVVAHVRSFRGKDSKFRFKYKEELKDFVDAVNLLGYKISIATRLIEIQVEFKTTEEAQDFFLRGWDAV